MRPPPVIFIDTGIFFTTRWSNLVPIIFIKAVNILIVVLKFTVSLLLQIFKPMFKFVGFYFRNYVRTV